MKYNTARTVASRTVNKAGGEAYDQTPKMKLASLLLTSFANDQFYRSENQTYSEMIDLIKQIDDKKFPAKAAIYARNEFGMRSITHALTVELLPYLSGQPWGKEFICKVVRRPDDITEIVAYYKNKEKNKSLSNQLKKGLAKALNKFDEYQLAKYRGDNAAFKLVDIMNLTHPVPTESNSTAFKKLINGQLKSTDTWETKLTQAGQKAETDEQKAEMKKEAWVTLLTENRLGYFALLKNLRNIIEQAPEAVDLACTALVNEKAIKQSLVLPFRFTTAIDEIAKMEGPVRKVQVALNNALELSLNNVPHLPGSTLIAIDGSGSMTWGYDAKSPIKIASLFGAVLYKTNNADLMIFDTDVVVPRLNPSDSLSTIRENIYRNANGGGTDFNLIFSHAKVAYDRIIILSDMQAWVGYNTPGHSFAGYRQRTGANPVIYSFDLQGYGTMQFPKENVYQLTGFSDKVFDIMKLLETDKNALLNKIEAIEL